MKKDFVVIFDLDGTLLNTDTLIEKSFDHVFAKYKPDYQLSKEEHLSFLGPPLRTSLGRYFPECMLDELVECYREYNHVHHEDFVSIYPTVLDTLKVLKEKGYPLAVLTTKFSQAAYIGLNLFDLTQYFDIVVGMDQLHKMKPDPEGIELIMQQLDCHKAIMIGDNPTDIMAGKNACVYTAGVAWTPKGSQALSDLKPDVMLDKMSDIICFIERKEK